MNPAPSLYLVLKVQGLKLVNKEKMRDECS